MALAKKDIEKIEELIQEKLASLSLSKPAQVYEIELRERMVRVEEELKHQRELMKEGFELMEKRFEAIDKRFETMEKRFEAIDKRFEAIDKRFETIDKRLFQFMVWTFGITFTATGILIAVIKL